MDNLGNYANALADYTELTKDISHLEYAIQLHQKALDIEPYHLQHLNAYVVNLLTLFHFNADNILLDKAYAAIQKTLSKNINDTYNLACYFSLSGKPESAKTALLRAAQYENIPSLEHLEADKDLDNIRNETWFIEFIERLKEKDKTT